MAICLGSSLYCWYFDYDGGRGGCGCGVCCGRGGCNVLIFRCSFCWWWYQLVAHFGDRVIVGAVVVGGVSPVIGVGVVIGLGFLVGVGVGVVLVCRGFVLVEVHGVGLD